MNNRTCLLCRNYHEITATSGECRADPPNGEGEFPPTSPDGWCGRFSATTLESSPGRKPKIADEVIVELIRRDEKDGLACKRADVVRSLGEEFTPGLSPSAALSRILKLVRNGILQQGPNPPPKMSKNGDGIYVWLTAKGAEKSVRMIDQIRQSAPDAASARSMRGLHKLCNPDGVALSTYSARLNAMVEDGSVIRSGDGYYAAPVAQAGEVEV